MYLSSATNRITVTWGNYGKVSGSSAAQLPSPADPCPPLLTLSSLCPAPLPSPNSPSAHPPSPDALPHLPLELLSGLVLGAATDLLRAAAEVENHRGQASGAVQGAG